MATRVHCILIVLLFTFTSSCYARPEPSFQEETNVTSNDQTIQCNSCRDAVGFTRRLFDTSDIDELKTNLTKWCVASGNGATHQVCRNYIDEGIKALERVGSSFLCERVHACPLLDSSASPVTVETVDDGTKCDFCINVVTSLKQIVASPETEKEFKECLGNACFHIGALKDECVELVDKNLDSLFKYLRERMNPRQVCKSTGYCATSATDATRLQAAVADTASVAASAIINVGPVYPVEIESIEETVAPHQLQFVPATSMQPAIAVTKPDPVKCLMCKHIVSDVMKKIKNNKTEQMIIDRLDGVCTRILPQGRDVQECERLVSTYTKEIVDLIVKENDPKKICQMLNICAQKKISSSSDDFVFCDECQVAGDWIFQQITYNSTQLTEAIDSVCLQALPVDVTENCQQFILDKKDALETSFRLHNDSLSLCQDVQLCEPKVIDETERESETAPLPSCIICKKIVKWIHQEIRGNQSEIAIENALRKVCKHMKHVEKCDEKVEVWSRQIVTALKIGTDPDVVCVTLGQCGGSSIGTDEAAENEIESFEQIEGKTESSIIINTEASVEQMVNSSTVCYECQMIAHFIQQELYDFEHEKRIQNFIISRVCSRAKDETVKETCTSFVNEYGSSIMQLISQEAFEPHKLCHVELNLCPKSSSTSSSSEPKLDIELTNSSTRNQLCSICEDSVRQLDSVLSTLSASERQAETLIVRVCSSFTDHKKQQCEQIIEAFGAHLQQLIGRLSNPNEVCRSIDLCYQVGQLHLLGGHKCTFGPTYWCYTAAHADSCKASEFCKTKVWKAVEQVTQ